jgi:hypothetical protein
MVAATVSRRPAFLKPVFLGAEFNDFLFASIGSDASGTYLTVLSALARLDLDPWAEAAKFSRMPGSVAIQKLAELISRFPEIAPVRFDSARIAARLTALLPGTSHSSIPAPRFSTPAVQASMATRFRFVLMSVTFGVMLVTQLIASQLHPSDQIKIAAQTVTRLNSLIELSPGGSNAHK